MDALVQQLFAEAGAVVAAGRASSRSAATDAASCASTRTSTCSCCSPAPIGPQDERFLHAFLNPLWDLGLTVGHHVREVQEGARLEADNPEFLLALTDARAVVGDATLLDQFTGRRHERAPPTRTLDALKALIAERHARFNDTLYQLEPDVKEAPGGLRDLFGAQTIAMLTDPALLGQGGSGPRALEDAEEFLLRVRSILHLEAKRHHNVLGHELQERAAERLRLSGRHAAAAGRAVHGRLLPPCARHRPVAALGAARRAGADRPQSRARGRRHPVRRRARGGRPSGNLAGGVSGGDRRRLRRCPTRRWPASSSMPAGSQPEEFFPTAAHRDALLQFLKPRPGLYARLSEMHDCGLLGQMIPEFKAINCRVVRDFYHKYTVDEHTLLTIRNLERLHRRRGPSASASRACSASSSRRSCWCSRCCSTTSASGATRTTHVESTRMAQADVRAAAISTRSSRRIVEFLVSQHLKMSLVAFRRDTEDPEIVRQFAELVGVEERLKMLCLMTLADVEAVSRETLTPWKEELLWRLYVDTYNFLTLSYGDEVIDRDQRRTSERHRRTGPPT